MFDALDFKWARVQGKRYQNFMKMKDMQARSDNFIVDGYPYMRDGGWYAAALPLIAIEGERLGLNFTVIPTIKNRLHGAITFQFKLRVW